MPSPAYLASLFLAIPGAALIQKSMPQSSQWGNFEKKVAGQ